MNDAPTYAQIIEIDDKGREVSSTTLMPGIHFIRAVGPPDEFGRHPIFLEPGKDF